MTSLTPAKENHVFTVSELNQIMRHWLEELLPHLWIEGEIANFVRASSGHWYFSLKDQHAQIRCVLFKSAQTTSLIQPENGQHVLLRVTPTIYEAKGDFQLIVERLEEIGIGALQRAFEALKKKLLKEKLFDPQYKKPLPLYPKTIGIITSPTGAAIRDVIKILKRRWPIAPVFIYPTAVQGEEAPQKITQALQLANQNQVCDVLILCRGGGSLEDLKAFNDEVVAREIFKSDIPIITGIGHQTDITIADFVADRVAATPSEAAEIVTVRDQYTVLAQLERFQKQINQWMTQDVVQKQTCLTTLLNQLRYLHPTRAIQEQKKRLQILKENLSAHQVQHLQNKRVRFENLGRVLMAFNPFEVLERGYAITTKENGQVVRCSTAVTQHEKVMIQLAKGRLACIVEKITP